MLSSNLNQSTQTASMLIAYRSAAASDLQLKAQILQLNSHLVYKVLQNPTAEYVDDADFVEAGMRGLDYAIETFDLDGTQTFKAFAIANIHQFIQNYAGEILEQALVEQSSKPKIAPKSTSGDDTTASGIIKAETMQVFALYRSKPSQTLRDRLVNLNIGLAKKEAHHWSNQCTESYDDLLQVGSMGLLRAIERFDLDKGFAFSTFAVPYIRGEIQHYLRDKSPTLKMPRQWLDIYSRGCKVIRQMRQRFDREPLDAEIAEFLDITVVEWQEIKLACKNRSPLSLDAPVHNDDDDGSTPLGELMQDSKYKSFQLAEEDNMRLHQALSHLEGRTRQIVEFVFLKEFTHREVAEILGISAVTVSRQLKKGIVILKEIMSTPID